MDVRVDEAREDVLAGGVDHLAVALQRARGPELGDRAAADEDVALLVEPGARVEDVGAADQQLGPWARTVEQSSLRRSCHRRQDRSSDEQLVEDRHPHRDPGLDLVADQRLRRVDRVGRQLDAAVDRARDASATAAGPSRRALIW